MVIRKRAELDTTNPPGCIRPAHMEKPLQGHIEDYLSSSEHNEDETQVVQMAEYFREEHFKGGQSE